MTLCRTALLVALAWTAFSPSRAEAAAIPDAALRAMLACDAAEHAAWTHSVRVLDERYTLGTRAQRDAALGVVESTIVACDAAAAAMRAVDADCADQLAHAATSWRDVARDGRNGTLTVSDVLESMRDMTSLPALTDLDAKLKAGEHTASAALAATLHRRVISRHLRGAFLEHQAEINRVSSDLAAAENDVAELRAEHSATFAGQLRTATAALATQRRTLTTLRRGRTVLQRALTQWRGSASIEAVLALLTGTVDPRDLPFLETHLRE